LTDLVRFETTTSAPLLVEVEDEEFGTEHVSRDENGIVEASKRLDEALRQAEPNIRTVVDQLRALTPNEVAIEVGLKLNAEAGVVIAKTAAEGHFTITLKWASNTSVS
jgi:hypothetical protein